jgi:hypothetical protein
MSVRVILGREAMLQQMNAQGPCYSTPKENLLHFSISSVGRLLHPHSPLLFHSNQASAKSAYGQKKFQENSIGCFEPFQKES